MSTPPARLKALHNDIQQGRALAALPEIERLVRKEPRNPALMALKAEALHRTGRHREAGHNFRTAADLGGGRIYWLAAGTLLTAMRDFDDAVECLNRALAEDPDDTKTLDALIFTFAKAERHSEGVVHARRQLTLSNDAAHLTRAAQLLLQTGTLGDDRYAECADALRKADQLAPYSADIWGSALVAANYICDWDWSESLQERIRSCYARGNFELPNESAFWNLTWCNDEAINLGTARAQVQRRRAGVTINPLVVKALPPVGRRLRVGYLSSDFCDHATLHLMIGLFEQHDRSRFEIFAYDYSRPDESEFRKRFLAVIEHHVPLGNMDDAQVAARIAADQLDILFDLKLYTRGLRPNIIAHRPAPLIATYLGFPGTSGTPNVDYAVTDRFVTPDSSAPFWTEKFCRLPHSYQCNDRRRSVAPSNGGRAAHGLPEGAIVFASFNQAYKLDRGSFRLWMQILAAVPGSVLWLLQQSRAACDYLLRHAQAAGIDPARIIFAPPLTHPLHRARLPLADVVLDALICNGHTTTSDALWAGVPVVTARGQHFASRVSESLLNAVGLPELVGADPQAMATIAIRLGTDNAYRAQLRQHLDATRLTSPLFDIARLTRDFETAIQMMVERQRQGLPPEHLEVPDAGAPYEGAATQVAADVLSRRQLWLPLIEQVIARLRASGATMPTTGKPLWIDLGCGDGGLLMSAAAAGFGGIGLDTDAERVERLKQQGCKALMTSDLAAGFLSIDLNAGVSVISLLSPQLQQDAVRPVLEHALKALHPGGVLLLGIAPGTTRSFVDTLLLEIGFEVAGAVATADPAIAAVLAIRRGAVAAAAVAAQSLAKRGAQAYRIIHVRPPGYIHTEALTEMAETVYYGLKQLGVKVYFREPDHPASARPIVFGAHLFNATDALGIPADAIIFNSEQIYAGSAWLKGAYLPILKTHLVWDYNAENARKLQEFGVPAVQHVPLGFVREHTRIAPAVEDIDVLFYGSTTPRRLHILEQLRSRGLKVHVLFGVYGEARDQYIARSKVVLNLHQYDGAGAKAFEIVRVSYLLENAKAVVAECGPDSALEADLRQAFRGVPYEGLVDACVELVRDDAARKALAAEGQRLFSQRPAAPILARALEEEADARVPLANIRWSRVQSAELPKGATLPVIEVVAVAHRRIGELRVFVQSWLNQSSERWRLNVLHDGPDEEFLAAMRELSAQAPERIRFECTAQRFNDYGHSLREIGLQAATGDYVLITNADNYYVPKAVEYLIETIITNDNPEVVIFDMIHSYYMPGSRPQQSYNLFETSYERGSIDMGSAVVQTRLARKAGFHDKGHDGDATYFEDVAKAQAPEKLRVCKLPRVLLVHN